MIEEIADDMFRIELPIPNSPLQTVNTYLLKGEERDLLVDSGMDEEECKASLQKALHNLGTNLEKIDFFITHLHIDHFGLAPTLASNGATIYLNAPEAFFFGNINLWEKGFEYGKINGFPEEDLKKHLVQKPRFLKEIPRKELRIAAENNSVNSPDGHRFQILGEGDDLNIGNHSFKCVFTPGHSRGHTCLYEPSQKIIFSGDHILEDITPAIFLWPGEDRDPLAEYLKSLDKVFGLDVSYVLPGHRSPFQKHRKRIKELKQHHQDRENEITSVMNAKGKHAFEIASKVTWNIPRPWDEFALELKWMALAETLAHLNHLAGKKEVHWKYGTDNICYYYLPQTT